MNERLMDEELRGWKAIARYLGREVRTVQLWEQEKGLPVQRMPGSKGTVYASRLALEQWRTQGEAGSPPVLTEATTAIQRLDGGLLAPLFVTSPAMLVLPFHYLGPGGSDHNFIGTAIAEEILTRLTAAPHRHFRVLSWTSSLMSTGQVRSVADYYQTLGVRYLLEGSVREAGSRWVINVRLVDAKHDRSEFSDKFSAPGRDVLGLQNQIAETIAGHLNLHFDGNLIYPFWSNAVHTESYLPYLKAVRLAAESNNQHAAVRALLNESRNADPSFAPADSQLAIQCFREASSALYSTPLEDEAKALAKLGYSRAPETALGQFVAARSYSYLPFDWARCFQGYESVLQLLPQFTLARLEYARKLFHHRRFAEADEALNLAEQSSDDEQICFMRSLLLNGQERFSEATDLLDNLRAKHPTNPLYAMAQVYDATVNLRDSARFEAVMAGPMRHVEQEMPLFVGAYRAIIAGDQAVMRSIRAQLIAGDLHNGVWAHQIAHLSCVLEDDELALQYLRNTINERNSDVSILAIDYKFKRLRGLPAFQQILRDLGLPEPPLD